MSGGFLNLNLYQYTPPPPPPPPSLKDMYEKCTDFGISQYTPLEEFDFARAKYIHEDEKTFAEARKLFLILLENACPFEGETKHEVSFDDSSITGDDQDEEPRFFDAVSFSDGNIKYNQVP